MEKYFAPLPAGPKVEKMKPQPVELKEEKRIEMTDRVGLPRLIMVWPTVPEFAEDEAGARHLGRQFFRRARPRGSKNRSSARSRSPNRSRPARIREEIAGVFMIDATAQPGHTLAELETAILEQVAPHSGAAADRRRNRPRAQPHRNASHPLAGIEQRLRRIGRPTQSSTT